MMTKTTMYLLGGLGLFYFLKKSGRLSGLDADFDNSPGLFMDPAYPEDNWDSYSAVYAPYRPGPFPKPFPMPTPTPVNRRATARELNQVRQRNTELARIARNLLFNVNYRGEDRALLSRFHQYRMFLQSPFVNEADAAASFRIPEQYRTTWRGQGPMLDSCPGGRRRMPDGTCEQLECSIFEAGCYS